MYANGNGVPLDNVIAHMWWNLANARPFYSRSIEGWNSWQDQQFTNAWM